MNKEVLMKFITLLFVPVLATPAFAEEKAQCQVFDRDRQLVGEVSGDPEYQAPSGALGFRIDGSMTDKNGHRSSFAVYLNKRLDWSEGSEPVYTLGGNVSGSKFGSVTSGLGIVVSKTIPQELRVSAASGYQDGPAGGPGWIIVRCRAL